MNELTDQQLLCDYAEHQSEAAFSELVRRHVDLIYSAALRMVCDAHLAKDVTQSTFVALAQNARQLTGRPVLSGWLHRTAQNLAAKAVRSDVRRRAREQEAANMNELLAAEPAASWEEIAPHLDAALGELAEADRDALLLRFFEGKSAREMAQVLGVSDEAAQKRVSRAVERLREFFAKRGVTVGASGLVIVISANAVQAAPVGLAITISTAAALVGTTIAITATATATKAIAMTTLQKTIVTATVAVLAGVGVYEARQVSRLRAQVRTIQQQPRPLPVSSNDLVAFQGKLDLLAAQNDELTSALAQVSADKTRLEMEWEHAKRAAALYKELADQAGPADKSSTNAYPTARHLWAGWGRMGRLMALSNEDQSKLSSEEKSAIEAARMKGIDEILKLVKASKQFEKDESSKSDSQAAYDWADMGACLFYGALNLDEQQFGQVYGLIQKFHQEARQGDLLGENPTPDTATALKQMMEQFKTEMETFLTPEQARIFAGVLPHINVGRGAFGLDIKF